MEAYEGICCEITDEMRRLLAGLDQSNVDIYTGVDGDIDDRFNSFNGCVNFNNSLVDAHFEVIPGL